MKNNKFEVQKWINKKINFAITECDLAIEQNEKVLENLKNISSKLTNTNEKLTSQTRVWLRERIKFIEKNCSNNDIRAIKTLQYFKYIQSL